VIKKVSEFAKIRRGASPRPIADPKYFGGKVGWVRISDVSSSRKYLRKTTQYVSQLGESLSIRVDKGDLIMSIAGTVGRPMIIDMPACIHDGFVHIYDLKDTNNEYLYYSLQFIEDKIKSLGQAGTQVNLNTGIVGDIEIFFPSNSEQKTIAKILSTIDQSIEKTEQLIAKYERIKTGLMQDLLTRGIDENGDIRTEGVHEFKDSPLGRIPKEWEVKTINSICLNVVDCPHSTPNYLNSGILVARTMHIKNGQYDESNSSHISEIEYVDRIQRLEPQPNDIIFTREAPVGEAFIIPKNMKICLGQRVMLFRLNLNFAIPEYLIELIYYQDTRLRFDSIVGGTTNPHVNVSDVKSFKFAFPKTDEQKRISNSLKEIRSLIEKEQVTFNKISKLKISLMQDLLTGEVRVDNII
jgi:type I restriction enzyme, S subunit